MRTRSSFLLAATLAVAVASPVAAAKFEKSGQWVFTSKAFAEDGDRMLYDCVASTQGVEGTELSLRLEPAPDAGFDASLTVTNGAWALTDGPVRVRFDIGADHWVLPGEGAGQQVSVTWTGDPALLTFLEDLASSSFAGLAGRDGTTVAQFSLKGSRGAIEAMKTCAETQIGQGLGEGLGGGAASDGTNPF